MHLAFSTAFKRTFDYCTQFTSITKLGLHEMLLGICAFFSKEFSSFFEKTSVAGKTYRVSRWICYGFMKVFGTVLNIAVGSPSAYFKMLFSDFKGIQNLEVPVF